MSQQRAIFSVVSIVVSFVFLCTNCVWSFNLAVQSRLAEVLASARVVYTGTALHSALVTEGIGDMRALYEGQDRIDRKLRETIGDAADQLRTLIFKDEKGGIAYYTFSPDGFFYRFTTSEEVDDPFNRLIEGFARSRGQRIEVPINGDIYYQEIIEIPPQILGLINTCLSELYPEVLDRGIPKSGDGNNPGRRKELYEKMINEGKAYTVSTASSELGITKEKAEELLDGLSSIERETEHDGEFKGIEKVVIDEDEEAIYQWLNPDSINRDIFRDYDYRSPEKGSIDFSPKRLFFMTLTWVSMAIKKAEFHEITDRRVVIARDCRKCSPEVIDAMIRAVEYSGLKAIYVGDKTPNCAASYAWAVRKHHPLMGIFLTASYVKGDNVMGAKVSIRGRSGELESLDTTDIQKVSFERLRKILGDPNYLGLIKPVPIPKEPDDADDVITTYTEMARIACLVASGAFKQGLSKKPDIYDLAVELEKEEKQDILVVLDKYRQIVDLDSKPFKGLRIVIEAAHTPSGKLAKGVYEALGAEVFILHEEIPEKGLSGQHKADPSIDENLKELKDTIEKYNAHFGLAFDLDDDMGAIVVPTNKKDSKNKTIFTTLAPDNLMVVLLPFFNKRGYSKKERDKVAVVRDVLSTKGVARKAKELDYKYRQTDAGYGFLKEAVREFKNQGFTVPIYAERSGHVWTHVTGPFEDPIVVSIFFAIMGMEYMQTHSQTTHPFIEFFQENTIPYKQSTRFHPLFTDSLLEKLARDRENNTGWIPGGKDKPPQKIIRMGRHKVIEKLLVDFEKDKSFDTPVGKLVVSKIIPIIDDHDETYRAADIRFNLDGSDAGSFVFRASANDPTWVCSFETPVGEGETLESESVQLRYECIGGLVLDYLEKNGYAKVFGEDFSYSNKDDAERALINYRIALGILPADFMQAIDHIMRMLGIKDYSRIIQTFKTSIDPIAFVDELKRISKKDVNTILNVLKNIPFFNTIALGYRVRKAKGFNSSEYGAKKLDVYIGDTGYELSGEPQQDIEGEPLSDYISAKRGGVSGVPFVFRDDMESYVKDFLEGFNVSRSTSPDLVKRISQIDSFFKNIDLSGVKYVITSGIGANEMYSHQLAEAVNACFKGVKWIVVNNPAHQSLIPGDADNTNTVIFEMSRSGSTQETVDFFNATKGQFKRRVVAANSGRLKEESLRLKDEPGAVIYNIDDIPGDIGGRQMNRKTLMVYVPLFMALVAGTRDIALAKELLKEYVKASLESNSSLSYSNGLDSEAVRMAEFLLRQRTGAGRKRFTLIYDPYLKATSKELFQLLNEGANKNIAGGTNFNILDAFSLDEREIYNVGFSKSPKEQMPIFLLNKNSPGYTDTIAYIEGLRNMGIPCIVVGVNLDLGEKPDLSHNLRVLARTTNLLQDMAVYFTYITNQDANSNPAVKFVREITAVMFDILREKKSKGETDIRITFKDVIEKIRQKRERDKGDAKQVMDLKGVVPGDYREEFDDFRDSIQELAKSLEIKAEYLTAAIISATSKSVVESDVGEAGGAKNADIDEAFSRTILLRLLGGESRPVRLDKLEKQLYLSKTERVAVSVALEKDSPLKFKGKEDLAIKIANYFYEMYSNKGRVERLTYVPLICMEADEENSIIKEILRDMLDNLSDLGISCPRLFLPRAAHTGIEAVMSHPENIFLVSIVSTQANGGELGNKPIDGQTTIDDATYVYGIGNVIRMALGGSPSVIFEITDSNDLQMVRDTLKKAFSLFRERIEEDKLKPDYVDRILQEGDPEKVAPLVKGIKIGDEVKEVGSEEVKRLLKRGVYKVEKLVGDRYALVRDPSKRPGRIEWEYDDKRVKSAIDRITDETFGRGYAYDVRGVLASNEDEKKIDLDPDMVCAIAFAIGSRHKAGSNALVTADHRDTSYALRKAVIEGLKRVGINVVYSEELVPTGAASYHSVINSPKYNIVIQISGSHNPWYGSGLKITEKQDEEGNVDDENGVPTALYGINLLKLMDIIKDRSWRKDVSPGEVKVISNVVDEYVDGLDRILPEKLRQQGWKVIVDYGNGLGIYAERLLRERLEVVSELCKEPDAYFPNHPAQPDKESSVFTQSGSMHLEEGVRRYNEGKAGDEKVIGILYDGDGDRAGVVDEEGRVVLPDRMLILNYMRFLIENEGIIRRLHEKGYELQLALDIRASKVFTEILDEKFPGVKGVFIPAGYPSHRQFVREEVRRLEDFIRTQPDIKDDPDILRLIQGYTSAEASGHFFYSITQYEKDRPFLVVDDGIYSVLLFLDAVNIVGRWMARNNYELDVKDNYTISEVFRALPEKPITREHYIECSNKDKFDYAALVETEIRRRYRKDSSPERLEAIGRVRRQNKKDPLIKVEDSGFRIQFKDGSWFVFRPSNTSPKITLKFEAETWDRVLEMMLEIKEIIGMLQQRFSGRLGLKEFLRELERVKGLASKKDVQGSHIVRKIQIGGEKLVRSLSIDQARDEIPALKRLEEIYGLGITTQVDELQIVENLGGEGVYPEGRAPLASYRDGVLKVDKLVFDYGDLIVFEEVEHELLESIAGLIPGITPAMADIVSTVRNVERFLTLRIEEQEAFLDILRGENPIDPDGEYSGLLERLRAIRDPSEEEIIKLVIGYVLRTKLYEKVRDELGLPEEIAQRIMGLDPRVDDVLEVLNLIAGAKEADEIALEVVKTFTGLRVGGLEKLPRGLARMVSAVVKQVSNVDRLAGKLARSEGKRYILVDDKRIRELRDVMGDDKYRHIERQLGENNYEVVTELPGGVDINNVIRLVDPVDVEGMERVEGMLYLPMPYTKSSLYMAAVVLGAGGEAGGVDSLVKGFIGDLYSQVLGRPVMDSDLWVLFWEPWRFLPEIRAVSGDLDNLRKAIALIEEAA